MGACFNSVVLPHSYGIPKIKKVWASMVNQSLYEDGHSYSGGIGMLGEEIESFSDLRFKNKSQVTGSTQAEQWLCQHQEKWQRAKAVSFIRGGKRYWMIGGWCSS